MNLRRSHFIPLLVVCCTWAIIMLGQRGLQQASAHLDQASALRTSVAGAHVIASNRDRLQFVLNTPAFDVDGNGVIAAPGLQVIFDTPGAPALPAYTTYIALPAAAQAEIHVREGDTEQHRVRRIQAVPQHAELPSMDLLENLAAFSDRPDYSEAPEIYGNDRFYPGVQYRLSEPMYYRDMRLVRLDLFPFQYNPVLGILDQVSALEVTVDFTGASWEHVQPVGVDGDYLESIEPMVMNFEEAQNWRSLPPGFVAPTSNLPTNQDTFKIAVNANGIYELTYDALANAGMDVDNVDPNTFEMMYRGEPVSFQFLGNDNADFEPHEKIRFYGWKFDGSRLERQFLTENIFWLWSGGSGQRVDTYNANLSNPVASSFQESITREPDLAFTHLWTDNWENAPNEPDAWIWDRIIKKTTDWPVLERTYQITLPAPVDSGSTALVTVEILSREHRPDHHVSVYLNGNDSVSGSLQWTYAGSVNVTMTLPVSQLLKGVNNVHVVYHTTVTTTGNSTEAAYYMNRITVDYESQFHANDEQLIFAHEGGGRRFDVPGFSNGDPAGALVWEIGDRLQPEALAPAALSVSGSAPYTYSFGTDQVDETFIVTHSGNVRQPLSVQKYVGPDIDPTAGASWLVISHPAFLNQAQQLAAHRQLAGYGGFSTHIVNVQHIINQYGYGLPLPGAIHDYLQHALADWEVAPQYLVLLGDGTINPRQIPCNEGNAQCSNWSANPEPNYVLTDIVYTDQFVGLNPSDYSYALLVGDDLLPDIAVGRLAVKSAAEAQRMVDKIIHYETTRLSGGEWQKQVLFIADDPDTAGSFCDESQAVASTIPQPYSTETFCLPTGSEQDVAQARTAIHEAVNNPPQNGATFLNYRGHGAIRSWAGRLINLDDPDDPWTPWFNNEPLIILSMDCLDGHFAMPGYEALSEEFLAIDTYGSVAHWSSTGFGYDFQHGPLHFGFYEGLFDHGLTRIGNAVNFAKAAYHLESHHPSQLYSFTLQGDPAMEMLQTGLMTYLPAMNR